MPRRQEPGAGAPCPVAPVELSRYAAKRFLTLQAEAALAGCELHALAAGGFLLSRWGLTRELRDLAAVQALLAEISPPGGCLP